MRTWGQLRMQLQTSAPGVSLDLLDEYLNTRYEHILEATPWKGLEAEGIIETAAAYQSGTDTATLTVGSAAVTGTGTAWTPQMVGLRFYRQWEGTVYTVAGVQSAAAMTLDRPYDGSGLDAAGTVKAGCAYVLMQNVYPLPANCSALVAILDPGTGLPLAKFSRAELDGCALAWATVGLPQAYALGDDSDETSPPILHEVEFYPAPLQARGYPVQYRRAAAGFDGQNTAAAPLPWISDKALLAGARSDIATYMAGQHPEAAPAYLAQAAQYQHEFEAELGRLIRIDHQQRRGPGKMRMADRFTRHRLARATRGLRTCWGPGRGGPN